MTNLKKTLAVVLAFAMVLSMGFSAFAFSDVAEGTKVAEAVGILGNLGILNGFEDGTFKPDDAVTRAQMAAIICRALGYEDQATSSAGSTVFSDVAADHWAAGYINVAQSLQIINGYPDGTYLPENQVKYEEAVKMIVVALGYELDAQSKGGWSTGYLAVASREGITKNANGTVGAAANRGTIAVLVYNSLEVRLMDQSSWSTSNDGDEYAKTDDTILSKYLEVDKYEGVVEQTPFGTYATQGYEADDDAMMSFYGTAKDKDVFYTEYVDGKLVKQYDQPGPVDASLVQDVNALAGKKVVAYIGAEADDETGNRMVYAIAEKQGANKVTKISAAQLVEDGDKYWDDKDDKGNPALVVGYKEVGSSRINTLDLENEVKVVVNYGAGSATTAVVSTKTLASYFANTGGSIEFISNDANSKIDVILLTVYNAELGEAVVEAVSTEDEMITFDCYKGTLEDFDTEDEDVLAMVIKDGAMATVADIAANDTVATVTTKYDSFFVYYVSSKTVTGTVGSYDDESVEIGGEEYDISPLSSYESTSELSGKEGIFFLNVDGQIAYDEAEASKGNYAVVLAAGAATGINGGYEVEVVLADGTVATYPLATKAYVDNGSKDDGATYTALTKDIMTADNSTYRVEAANLYKSVYEITVKNDKITKLVTLTKENKETVKEKEYDAENMAYGSLSFNDATIVISVDEIKEDANKKTFVQSDDIIVGTVADFFVDGEGLDAKLEAYDEDNNDIAGLVLGFGLSSNVPQDGAAMVITSVKSKEIDHDDAYVITGMQAGKEVTYTVYDDEPNYDAKYLAKGNVILTAVANAEGIVKDFEILYVAPYNEKQTDGSYKWIKGTIGKDAKEDKNKEEYYVYGDLDKKTAPTDSKFYIAGEEAIEVVMRNSANYTLVDYTESTSNPEVLKRSKSKSIFGTLSKYDSEVFVRYYDDEIVEVVVFRTNAVEA